MHVLAVIANLLFPGTGLILVGRRRVGVVFALAFTAAVDAMFLSLLIGGRTCRTFVRTFACLAAVLWIWSLIRLALTIRFQRSPGFLEQKENLFRDGIQHYLRNELAQARDAFTHLLQLDGDDADAHLYLGLVYRSLNQPARARASLRRCRRYDFQRRWRWEVQEQLKRLQEARAS